MLDQLSPVAPARVRVVLLPIGQIKRVRFLSFVERLQPQNVIRLGDISPDGRPNRNMFNPLAFPLGMIVYDLTTHYPPSTHLSLSPFELYREPLVIIALADGAELEHISYKGTSRKSLNGGGVSPFEQNVRDLYQDLEDLRDRYPKALVHQVLLFDYTYEKSAAALPEGLVSIPPPADCGITTIKTVMCDISALLLAEMTTLARSLQALSTIESPSQSGNRPVNGGSWGGGSPDGSSRRNSQFALPQPNSRSASPAGAVDRSNYRMSMPVLRSAASDSGTSSPLGRADSPASGLHSGSPPTFDNIIGDNALTPKNLPSRLGTPSSTSKRDSSRDRVSIVGFGSGSTSERSRNKGKSRIGIVVGSMYMCAGRWNDALRELVESAAIAKANLDHLWHAKALDNILVSMLMLAWTGLDFQIPQICYVSAEKTPSLTTALEPRSPTSNRLVSLQNLAVLLPELLDRILNLYTRASNNTGEAMPQYPFSETVIRYAKLSSALHTGGGQLDDEVLRLIVLGTPFQKAPNLATPRLNIQPTRGEILKTILRAFPVYSSSENIVVVDRIIILSGIASVLGSLGYNRKKAMVIRELVSVLVPALVQARLRGAAEMGVHPAAGLAALSANGNTNGAGALELGEGDMENGVDSFLALLGQTYGVVASRATAEDEFDDSDEAIILRILDNSSIRSFGSQALKMEILRSCINLSEALPDFQGVMKFTADLLRTAGSGVAPGPRSEDASPNMSREEQMRLMSNITRTLGAAKNLGVHDLSAEYWDEFLVRGVELEPLLQSRTPIPHTRGELPGGESIATAREINPFIYNPFLRPPNASIVDHIMVAGEGAVFKVTLQNPYEFDVEIESIKLDSDGAGFESAVQKTVIGPYRTQILTILGTPTDPGSLKITGCTIKVKGCRERRFPIFSDSWSPQGEVKIKSIGVSKIFAQKARPTSFGSTSSNPIPWGVTPPMPTTVGLNVIDKQPIIAIKSTNLSQSALMVLEGERQRFFITLENLSKYTPVDLLLFSFKDSTQAPLQTAMSNREASPAELYEYELILARKQALRYIPKPGEKPYIEPGGIATFEIEILGKPGLTGATVQVDYAHLGVPQSEVENGFHTRQVSLRLTITVNASIELARMDVMPFTGNLPVSLWSKIDGTVATEEFTPQDHCLLILDLRNAWPSSIHVSINIEKGGKIDEEVFPGNTSRIMFPIPRIYLENPTASIPALDPSRQRQFVVSAGRISADSERATREAFWYREEILKILQGTWETRSGVHRKGNIELRGLRLNQRVIDAIRIEDISIDISINNESGPKHDIHTDTFSSITVRISNRSANPIHPLLRLQPSIRNHSLTQTLDLSKKFVWNGVLQQTLPQIPGKEHIEVHIGMTPLCRGEFELSASIEEVRLVDAPKDYNAIKEGGRPRADTKNLMDTMLGARERRIWHSREPCLLIVKDEDEDTDEDTDEDEDDD
ncbi:hypothetical protein SBOR_6753 [Sclerotinia borealis F-4128]|uniref:Hypercellular protein HypA n=1 Tax=Sclerotinia borealis (strain F-4128) TaxID=1432307 RepID=W9CE94_SCLBF|nr:hypothetical protein SBOR_6753 [Sclerotinia borealis F-4128]